MRKRFLFFCGMFLAAGATPALAQFTLRVQQGQNIFQTANGQTLNFGATATGQSSVLTLTGTFSGSTSASISSQPQVLGAPDFTVGSIGSPLTLQPGQSFTLTITYTASNSTGAVAQLLIPFTQAAATAGQPPASGTITLNLTGSAPNFSVNYLLPPNNNVTPVSDGGAIAFPATLVKAATAATIIVANLGSGPGTISSATLSGAAFQFQGLGLLPVGLPAGGGSLSFGILYSPVKPGTDTGKLTIAFPNQTIAIDLTGTATSSIITYSAIDGATVTPLTAGQTITVPNTPIGVLRSIAIQAQNTGTASATINSISLSGAGFAITNPPLLPLTLAPGDSFTFTLNFTPGQAGAATGTLSIGPDRFQLAGNGIGAQLTYMYASGSSAAVTVLPQGTVLFPSTAVAQSSLTTFTVSNTGTSSTTLTSLGIVGAGFAVQNAPPLPATLGPNGTYTFTISFTPTTPGLSTATLAVNGPSFVLSGFGTSLPTLQSYAITGASGTVQPYTQPGVGLNLTQSYPLDLNGTLAMSVNSNVFVSDPAVQFTTGGRTILFTIPAGTTQAVFSNGAAQIQLQTGTVAETIVLSATFSINGGLVISPLNNAPLTLTVAPSAPQLLSVQQQGFTAGGFSVLVQGFSTTRALTNVNLQFSGAPGLTISGASLTVDVTQSAGFWYSSSAATGFGGFFAITIPVNVRVASGSVPATLAGQFTVAATVGNASGTSNSMIQ